MTKLSQSSDVGKVFWLSLLVVFFICGAALLAFKFRPATAAGSYAAIVAWMCLVAFCALLLRLISKANDLLQALVAMWRPIVLVLVAAWLLFVNDQGRELGVSLMGEKQYWRIGFLFLALIYWATNNWHTSMSPRQLRPI